MKKAWTEWWAEWGGPLSVVLGVMVASFLLAAATLKARMANENVRAPAVLRKALDLTRNAYPTATVSCAPYEGCSTTGCVVYRCSVFPQQDEPIQPFVLSCPSEGDDPCTLVAAK